MDEAKNIMDTTFREILGEHELIITDGTNAGKFFLIEVDARAKLFDDYKETFAKKGGLQVKVAKKVLKTDSQTYGVVIDQDLQYVFAFNRQFADFHGNQLKFVDPERYVLDVVENGVQGKRGLPKDNESDLEVTDGKVEFTHPSLMGRVVGKYTKERVEIDGQNYFLVDFSYTTSFLQDLVRTYGDDVDQFKRKLAEEKFGDEKKSHRYGVLFDEDLRMRFVYNKEFAEFEDGAIVFTSLDDILVPPKVEEKRSIMDELDWTPPRSFSRPRCTGGRACYALVGPKD